MIIKRITFTFHFLLDESFFLLKKNLTVRPYITMLLTNPILKELVDIKFHA